MTQTDKNDQEFVTVTMDVETVAEIGDRPKEEWVAMKVDDRDDSPMILGVIYKDGDEMRLDSNMPVMVVHSVSGSDKDFTVAFLVMDFLRTTDPSDDYYKHVQVLLDTVPLIVYDGDTNQIKSREDVDMNRITVISTEDAFRKAHQSFMARGE